VVEIVKDWNILLTERVKLPSLQILKTAVFLTAVHKVLRRADSALGQCNVPSDLSKTFFSSIFCDCVFGFNKLLIHALSHFVISRH